MPIRPFRDLLSPNPEITIYTDFHGKHVACRSVRRTLIRDIQVRP
jgi:hypothetical protein